MQQQVIILPYGMRREIARELRVNERTVGRALRGETDGPKSNAVRKVALQRLEVLNDIVK